MKLERAIVLLRGEQHNMQSVEVGEAIDVVLAALAEREKEITRLTERLGVATRNWERIEEEICGRTPAIAKLSWLPFWRRRLRRKSHDSRDQTNAETGTTGGRE